MDDIKMRSVLCKDVFGTNGLYSLGWYLSYTNGEDDATLDGDFSAEELEAIACYMRKSQEAK